MTISTDRVMAAPSILSAGITGLTPVSPAISRDGNRANLMNTTELVGELRCAREELVRLSAALPDAAMRQRPTAEEWSLIEILAHVKEVGHYYLGQALAIRDNPNHIFVPFDAELSRVEHLEARQEPTREITDALEESHQRALDAVYQTTSDGLNRTGNHRSGGSITVRDIFLLLPEHARKHCSQIDWVREHLMM